MKFSTPEEGYKLIETIRHKITKMEENQKELELEKYFVDYNIYDLQLGDTCYLAIYIDSQWKGGIVKVKLDKRISHNEFYFVGVENDIIPNNFGEWKIASRPNHPYLVNSTLVGIKYVEPITYSDCDNIRNAKVLQLKA